MGPNRGGDKPAAQAVRQRSKQIREAASKADDPVSLAFGELANTLEGLLDKRSAQLANRD